MSCTATDLVYNTTCNEPVTITIDPLGVCPGATLLPWSGQGQDSALGSPARDENPDEPPVGGPGGTVARLSSRSFKYTPGPNCVGQFFFSYTIKNSDGVSSGTVFVKVAGDPCSYYRGVKCDDSTTIVWVKRQNPPPSALPVFRYHGDCYVSDLCSRCLPADAVVVSPDQDGITDCDAPQCGAIHYTLCDGASGDPADLYYRPGADPGAAVIGIDDSCYQRVGLTTSDYFNGVSPDATYDDCEECPCIDCDGVSLSSAAYVTVTISRSGMLPSLNANQTALLGLLLGPTDLNNNVSTEGELIWTETYDTFSGVCPSTMNPSGEPATNTGVDLPMPGGHTTRIYRVQNAGFNCSTGERFLVVQLISTDLDPLHCVTHVNFDLSSLSATAGFLLNTTANITITDPATIDMATVPINLQVAFTNNGPC